MLYYYLTSDGSDVLVLLASSCQRMRFGFGISILVNEVCIKQILLTL